jgi:uncharacterized protein DUF3501
MHPVTRESLLDYVTYEERRAALIPRILAEKARRRVHAGGVLTFLFENADTVRYQVQEMMRAEKIVRELEIRRELETYNELLGGPGELGCTLLIEIEDAEERREKLARWMELPAHLYVRLPDRNKVYARYDPRQVGEERLSSVHYLKFDTQGRAPIAVGCDLNELTVEAVLTPTQREALDEDLKSDR